ncbi:MAG: hybrid sensor histidine kinase/response regulator [Chloroflexi bacterium]|nr:hybrid sensor histidine kinase/response regulator [Chloroflexota bacterium]
MSAQQDEFLKQLRATFKVEAGEHLQAMIEGLLALEKSPAPAEQARLIEAVFRAAHSLKGAARAVNFGEVEAICQSLEDVFASWKRRESAPSAPALDTLHRALDAITAALAAPEPSTGAGQRAGGSAVIQSLRQLAAPVPPSRIPEAVPLEATGADADAMGIVPPPASDQTPILETVRIPVAKLDARLLQAEEMLAAKLTIGQRAADLGALAGLFEDWRKEWAKVQPDARELRQALDRPPSAPGEAPLPAGASRLAEFLEWNREYLRSLEAKVATLARACGQDRLAIGKLVDDLLEDSKQLLMVPLATLSALFPKLVRDLCRDQGKEADLTMRGEEVEIDKRIIEELKDPLIHLLRNCVDHGIERPAERIRLGKPPRAALTLAVTPVNGSKVEILVADDGAGIDLDKVKASAVKLGLITAAEARQLGESEALALAFQSEVSTSPIITALSGRGLGLAIVREKTEKLGGRVSVESRRGVGTRIRLVLPLTLATFRGILVQAAERLFIVPTARVERVARVRLQEIQTVEGRETISLDGRAVALARLAGVLELPRPERNGEPSGFMSVVVLGAGEQRVAFAVDSVRGEQEVLVKRLHKPLSRVRHIAGATVLGSGQIAPILNVTDLLKSAQRSGGAAVRETAATRPPEAEIRTVLVVEDSITSRLLLKGILESAGYKVKTAVDGVDAFTALRAESFDLVVSDVEMPRLNGFDLTAKIRADQKLAELPVVLVTALETREDRERGIDAGADAYIVKSSFDQSNLLEAVRRLI